MRFDRAKFYDGMREFEDGLSQQQVNGINSILDSMEKDHLLKRVEHAAYMFATVKPETAHTYQPIHEYGGRNYFIKRYGSQTKVGKRLGNDTPEEGAIYAGRGDVQLTGEDNYEKAERALRKYYPEIVADFEARTGRMFDLTVGDQPGDERDPDNAQDPAIAYAIMSFGMHTGMFTSRKLSDYDKVKGFDALNARAIINGDDHAAMIAGYYKHFLAILKAALVSDRSEIEQAAELPAVIQPEPAPAMESSQKAADPSSNEVPPSSSEPVEVKKEDTSLFVKAGAAVTAVTGFGINLGSLIQTKLEAMTVQQIVYMIAALGLIAGAIWWYRKAAKGAQMRTMQMVEKAADPNLTTVRLVK